MKINRPGIISVFTIAVATVFFLSSIFIVTLAILSIGKIQKELSESISEYLFERKAVTLQELIANKADSYNILLKNAMMFSKLLAAQTMSVRDISKEYANSRYKELSEPHLTYDKEKDIYANSPSSNPRIFYWGDDINEGAFTTNLLYAEAVKPMMEAIIYRYADLANSYFAVFIASEQEKLLIDLLCSSEVASKIVPLSREGFNKHYSDDFLQKTGWTKVYRDITDRYLVTTYADIYDEEGKAAGRAGVDFDIEYILKDLELFHQEVFHGAVPDEERIVAAKDSSFSFIIRSQDGSFIACPGENLKQMEIPYNETTQDDSYSLLLSLKVTDSSSDEIKKAFQEIREKPDTFRRVTFAGEQYLVFSALIDVNGWILCSAVTVNEFTSKISYAKRYLTESFIVMTICLILLSIIYSALCVLILYLIFHRILAYPVINLESGVTKLMKGEFGVSIKPTGPKEIYDMLKSFNFLSANLNRYSGELKEKLSNRSYIESEVSIAKKIQAAVLPQFKINDLCSFDIDISAGIISKEIISDVFYDYFPLSKDKAAFMIGEVSEKSIPAAFFMMVAKTLIKDACMKYQDNPAEVLDEVNSVLRLKNVDMFMSLGLAFYDNKKKSVAYSFAGFISAMKISASSYTEQLSTHNSPVLGLLNDPLFRYDEKIVTHKCRLIFFTRSVLDSVNKDGTPYSYTRILNYIKANPEKTASECAQFITDDISGFCDVSQEDKAVLVFIKSKPN